MSSPSPQPPSRSQLAARRLWVVLGLVLLSALVVVAIVHILVPERSNDIWVESAKSALQLAVLATTTGVVAAVLRDRDAAREADSRRRVTLLAYLDGVQTTYGQVKAARRTLRTLGFDVPATSVLSAEQANGFRTQMALLNEVELVFEADGRRVIRLRREIGPGVDEIKHELDGVARYLRQVLFEWEQDPTVVGPGGDASAIGSWPLFRGFVQYDEPSVRQFTQHVTDPIGRVETIILDTLGVGDG